MTRGEADDDVNEDVEEEEDGGEDVEVGDDKDEEEQVTWGSSVWIFSALAKFSPHWGSLPQQPCIALTLYLFYLGTRWSK